MVMMMMMVIASAGGRGGEVNGGLVGSRPIVAGQGSVVAVGIRWSRGGIDQRLRWRRRSPVFVGGRRMSVGWMVSGMVAHACGGRAAQEQATVACGGRHVVMMILVHAPVREKEE